MEKEYWINADDTSDSKDETAKIKKASGRIKAYQECAENIQGLINTIKLSGWNDEIKKNVSEAVQTLKTLTKNEQRCITAKKSEVNEYADEVERGYEFTGSEREELFDVLRRAFVRNQEASHYLAQIRKWTEILYQAVDLSAPPNQNNSDKALKEELKKIISSCISANNGRLKADKKIIYIKDMVDPVPEMFKQKTEEDTENQTN